MIKTVEYIIFQIFLFLVLFLQVSNVAAVEEPLEQWNRSFGGNGEDSAWCIQQTSEGGYIVAGTTASYGKGIEGYPDAWLIKVDKSGNMQWNKTYGETYFDEGYFTRQTSDGSYVLSGYTFPSGYAEPWLIKTDKKGNEMWNKVSDNITHWDYLQYRAERTSDGGYVIGDTVEHEIGERDDLVLVDYDIIITKYDMSGNQQWNNTFGKNHSLETLNFLLDPVKQTADGGYIIAILLTIFLKDDLYRRIFGFTGLAFTIISFLTDRISLDSHNKFVFQYCNAAKFGKSPAANIIVICSVT